MTSPAQLLVVSPDRALRQVVQQCLEALGHEPLVAESVPRARRLLARGGIDLLCLDSLVSADEAEIVWRAMCAAASRDEMPVLFFGPSSAKLVSSCLPSFYRRERDAIVCKPIECEELEREVTRLLAARSRRDREDIARVGSVVLDGGRHQLLFGGGGALGLTPTEYKLLRCLMQRAGEFVSAEELLEQVWGYPTGTGGPEIVRAHVSNLRRKLRDAGEDPQLLRTLPYRGYGFGATPGSRWA
jgi:DNA-binding response OmpR family regulator